MRKYQIKGTVYVYDKATGKMVEKRKERSDSVIEFLEVKPEDLSDELSQALSADNKEVERPTQGAPDVAN